MGGDLPPAGGSGAPTFMVYALRDAIDPVLDAMIADGTLAEIQIKWFGNCIAVENVDLGAFRDLGDPCIPRRHNQAITFRGLRPMHESQPIAFAIRSNTNPFSLVAGSTAIMTLQRSG